VSLPSVPPYSLIDMSFTNAASHLVTVWNPAYALDAMESHVQRLLELARTHDGDEDEVYVWWGKIRSSNRQQPLAHLDEILALDAELHRVGDDGEAEALAERELHLYLTDYRSLYVAHVGEITSDDPREWDDEATHVPAMYGASTSCDCWFKLLDVRRLVLDDTPGVIAELQKLRNVHYHDRPVSIYGGMVDLPLVVTRPDGARWFDRATRDRLTDGRFWVALDAERSGVGAVAASLRDDVLGGRAWAALDPAARLFVASAEQIFRDHRSDAAFDFSPVVVNLAKAYEVQCASLFGALRGRVPDTAWHFNHDGRTAHLLNDGPFGVGQLAHALGSEPALRQALGRWLAHGRWVVESLAPILGELASVRNVGAHGGRVDRETAQRLRDSHLGVGCAGSLVELTRAAALAHAVPAAS
jgi:hypothetical protein